MSSSTIHLANYSYKDSDCNIVQVNRAIQRDRDYKIIFNYPGDVTAGTPVAEIRDGTIEDSGVLLASFSFDPLTYDSGTDKTNITLTLDSAATVTIPESPEIKGTTLQSADKYYQWDCYLLLSGEKLRIVEQGFVQVLGRSTA